MAISLSCSCGAKLTAPPAVAGKKVKCPKCSNLITVPPQYEEIEEAGPPPKPAIAPAKSKRPADDEDDDRPPRRRNEDDEDEDYRPRKKKKKKQKAKSGGIPVWVWVAGGGLLLVGVVAIVILSGGSGGVPGGSGGVPGGSGGVPGGSGGVPGGSGGVPGGSGGVPGGSSGVPGGKSAPAGYTDARDAAGGFRVFLPGQAQKAVVRGNASAGVVVWTAHDGNTTVSIESFPLQANSTLGSQPDQLYEALKTYGTGVEAPWNEIKSKTPVTLGGKPGLEIRIQYKRDWMGKQQEGQNKVDTGRPERDLYLVATDGKRLIVVHFSSKSEFPSDDTLKVVRESLEFL